MSTNAIIAVRNPKTKKISAIYLHWDGYPSYAGEILKNHYTNQDKVNELIALGNCSILAPELEPDPNQPHNFSFGSNSRQENICLFYGRDRGDNEQQAIESDELDGVKDAFFSAKYLYLFENGAWTTEKL